MDSLWCPVLLAALAGSLCSPPARADRRFGKNLSHFVRFSAQSPVWVCTSVCRSYITVASGPAASQPSAAPQNLSGRFWEKIRPEEPHSRLPEQSGTPQQHTYRFKGSTLFCQA